MNYPFSVEVRCFCEFQNGGTGQNGIMCEKNGTFVKSTSCFEDELCRGPSSEEDSLGGSSNLCAQGNLIMY